MFILYRIVIFLIVICITNGCSATKNNENAQSSPLIKLSTQEQETDDNIQQESINDELQPETNLEQAPITEETAPENNLQAQHDQDSLQQTIPESSMIIEGTEKSEEQSITTQVTSTQLPFQDFKERWNAITDEQMSNVYIRNLEEVNTNEGNYYLSNLNNSLQLRIIVEQDFVQQLELINNDKSKSGIGIMLTTWSQMINILHSNIEIYDVDTLFNKIGVGPNGDLSALKPISFTNYGLHYDVVPTEKGYTFRAGYNKTQ